MPSKSIEGSSAKSLHSQHSLGLKVAYVQTSLQGEVVLIQVASEILQDHAKADKLYNNYQRLFAGQAILLWGDQQREHQATFAKGALLEALMEILASKLEWRRI